MMHTLLRRDAQYVNRIHRYRGHIFGDRFWARGSSEQYDVLSVLRDVHRNPLRAGVVPRLELYPWGSHRVYLGISGSALGRDDNPCNRFMRTAIAR